MRPLRGSVLLCEYLQPTTSFRVPSLYHPPPGNARAFSVCARRRPVCPPLRPLSKNGIISTLPSWQQEGGGWVDYPYRISCVCHGRHRLSLPMQMARSAQEGQLILPQRRTPGELTPLRGFALLYRRIVCILIGWLNAKFIIPPPAQERKRIFRGAVPGEAGGRLCKTIREMTQEMKRSPRRLRAGDFLDFSEIRGNQNL